MLEENVKMMCKRGEDGFVGKSYMGGQWWQLLLHTGEFVHHMTFRVGDGVSLVKMKTWREENRVSTVQGDQILRKKLPFKLQAE